jgi:mannose-6-phosphate isomerase-like protein (cupin superfamily)
VRKHEATDVNVGDNVIKKYFSEIVPDLGLATALINDFYPPSREEKWAINERVGEMYYVLEGTGKIIFQDGQTIDLDPECAVYITRGVKYRVEKARGLKIVVPTGHSWSNDHQKWIKD